MANRDMFLKLEGIESDSLDAAHENEIIVDSWSWGMVQSGTTHEGPGGGGGKVSGGDMSVAKKVDKATPAIMKHCCNGKHIPSGTLTIRESGGDAPVEYLKIEMETIMITSYQTGGSSDDQDRIEEHLTLNFQSYVTTFTEQTATGGAGASTPQGWNFAKNEKKE